MEQERARKRLPDEILPANKTAFFDALAAAEVRSITVQFDGYGDSGQIEEIEIDSPKPQVALLDAEIEFAQPTPDCHGVAHSSMTIREAIEHFVYGFLRDTHAGWEIDEGAYGEFKFDVASRRITLAYNERFTESEFSEHTF
jgi:hypothetical protein